VVVIAPAPDPPVAGAVPTATEPVGVGLPELGTPLPHRFIRDHDPRSIIIFSTSRKLSGNR
jgi:hypothetical protein